MYPGLPLQWELSKAYDALTKTGDGDGVCAGSSALISATGADLGTLLRYTLYFHHLGDSLTSVQHSLPDNRLAFGEFENACVALGVSMEREECQDIFKALDARFDGAISWDRFCVWAVRYHFGATTTADGRVNYDPPPPFVARNLPSAEHRREALRRAGVYLQNHEQGLNISETAALKAVEALFPGSSLGPETASAFRAVKVKRGVRAREAAEAKGGSHWAEMSHISLGLAVPYPGKPTDGYDGTDGMGFLHMADEHGNSLYHASSEPLWYSETEQAVLATDFNLLLQYLLWFYERWARLQHALGECTASGWMNLADFSRASILLHSEMIGVGHHEAEFQLLDPAGYGAIPVEDFTSWLVLHAPFEELVDDGEWSSRDGSIAEVTSPSRNWRGGSVRESGPGLTGRSFSELSRSVHSASVRGRGLATSQRYGDVAQPAFPAGDRLEAPQPAVCDDVYQR